MGRKKKKNRIPQDVAETVKERSQYFCEAMIPEAGCNGQGQHLHHRRMRSQGGVHTVQNLVHICESCHSYIHHHPAISYTKGWLVKSTRDPDHEPFLRRGGAVLLLEDGGFEHVAEITGLNLESNERK